MTVYEPPGEQVRRRPPPFTLSEDKIFRPHTIFTELVVHQVDIHYSKPDNGNCPLVSLKSIVDILPKAFKSTYGWVMKHRDLVHIPSSRQPILRVLNTLMRDAH